MLCNQFGIINLNTRRAWHLCKHLRTPMLAPSGAALKPGHAHHSIALTEIDRQIKRFELGQQSAWALSIVYKLILYIYKI